jgi:ABC-type transport system involved in cytochrome bd biosynthesis fused ATPase/permease subunit
LDQGRIVEQGSHHDLLERGGHYADLVHAQVAENCESAPSLALVEANQAS